MMFVQIRSLSVWNTGLIQKWKDSNDLPPVQYNHCLFQAKIMKLDLKNDDTHPNLTIISSSNQHLQISSHQLPQNKCQSKINLAIFFVDIYFWWKNGTKVLNQTSQAISLREAWRQCLEADLKEQHPGRSHQAQTGLNGEGSTQGHRGWPWASCWGNAGKCSKKQFDMMKWRNMVRMSLWKLKWLNESIDLIKHKFTVSVWWFLPRMSSQSACCMPGLKQPARIAPESCA